MNKKIFFVPLFMLFIFIANPLTLSSAKEKRASEIGKDLAKQFIENSLNDEAWKGNNPNITKETKFYTDDEKSTSYIEYKVGCDKNPDCGFILVNVDGNDVSVPISSPTGNTPSEIVGQGSNNENFYYFSALDIYSQNPDTGDIQAFDQSKRVDLRNEKDLRENIQEKSTIKEKREKLKLEFKNLKSSVGEFKKSDAFKQQKEGIKNEILSVPKEKYVFNMLDFTFADSVPDSSYLYTSPGTSNTFVPGSSTADCGSKIPCYDQFQQTYNGYTNCYSGCSPTAVAMLFG